MNLLYSVEVGIPVFGPSARAARMEGSKAFSKAFMARQNIPTAAYKTFASNQHAEAVEYVKSCHHRVVLKASGLAGGKGVLIPETTEEAIQGLKEIMVDRAFGTAGMLFVHFTCLRLTMNASPGDEVVVEEYLEGPELSVLAFSDGYTIVPLPAAQDHKRIGEGDTGPNTGGMGAYAPAPVATPEVLSKIMRESLQPTIDGMRREGEGISYLVLLALTPGVRLSIRWTFVHRFHADGRWAKGFGVQRPLWRSRNRGTHATNFRRHRPGCTHACESLYDLLSFTLKRRKAGVRGA